MAALDAIADIMPDLRRVFDGRWPLAYNFDFDRRMMQQTLSAADVDWPEAWDHWGQPRERYCLMLLYSWYHGDERWDGEYVWQKLRNAVKQCGIVTEATPHRALADAQAARAVLQHMARG